MNVEHPISPPRILIAEDNELQSSVLRAMLEGRGYQADIVTDGMAAVRRLRTGDYDLALLDYHMPEIDGLAAARLVHDFLDQKMRPRLIAITVAAQELSAKEEGCGGGYFDAVVSKRLGLPALLRAVDATLLNVAENRAAEIIESGRQAAQDHALTRRLRRKALWAALPGLVMAGLFVAGSTCALVSLDQVDATAQSAARTATLSANATLLVGAAQDTEASQRLYLATGQDQHRRLFEADAQRVDHLLVSSATLTVEGEPGFGANTVPQSLIETRQLVLAKEARLRSEAGPMPGAALLPEDADSNAAAPLRAWADTLVSTSQSAVLGGLDIARRHFQLVLGVLVMGVVYGLGSAAAAVHRRWRPSTKPSPRADATRRPMMPVTLESVAPVAAPMTIKGQYGFGH